MSEPRVILRLKVVSDIQPLQVTTCCTDLMVPKRRLFNSHIEASVEHLRLHHTWDPLVLNLAADALTPMERGDKLRVSSEYLALHVLRSFPTVETGFSMLSYTVNTEVSLLSSNTTL